MFSRAALAVFALVVAEYFVFGFAAQLVGGSLVIWISLAAALFGVFVIRRSFATVVTAGVEPLQNAQTGLAPGSGAGAKAADGALRIVGGFLLFVPGLLTGAVGVALLVPPVRALVRGRVRHWAEGLVGRGLGSPEGLNISFANGGGFFARRDVVDVDLHTEGPSPDDSVEDDGPTTAPPELH